MVEGMEMQNELAPHLCVVVENWKEYFGHRHPPQSSKGPQPHTGLPSPQHWCWEEKALQYLAVKIVGFS